MAEEYENVFDDEEEEDEELTAAERLRKREQEALAEMRRAEETAKREGRARERAELMALRLEEKRQCAKRDRFWGLDYHQYELDREAWERELMAEEDMLVEALRREHEREAAAAERCHAEAEARKLAAELEQEHNETVAMAIQEGLQTAIDRFWGLDTHEKKRREAAERQLIKEQEMKLKSEARKLQLLRDEWEAQGREVERQKRIADAHQQEMIRQQYMSLFFRSTSSADVINFKWPTFTDAETELYERVDVHEAAPVRSEAFDMSLVFSPKRVQAPVHTLHRLNPVKTVGKRHLTVGDAGHLFQLVPDLRPGAGPGVPPVAHSPTVTVKKRLQQVQKAGDTLRHQRRGSTTSSFQWPVPSSIARNGHHVTLRGWTVAASQVARHLGNPSKMRKNLAKYQRQYCALWRSSILYFFDSVQDFRDFFKDVDTANTCCGYIDLESAVSVRERKPTPEEEAKSRKSSRGSKGGEKKKGRGKDEPAPLRVMEIVCLGTTWLLCPDPAEEETRSLKEEDELRSEAEETEKKLHTAITDAQLKTAAHNAAAKKGPREGNYKLKMKAQTAEMNVKSLTKKLESLKANLATAEEHADTCREAYFESWLSTMSDCVAARNMDLKDVTRDPELTKPVQEVDPSRLQASTMDLIEAVTLAKMGPWAMPTGMMPEVERLTAFHRTMVASAASGNPVAKQQLQERGGEGSGANRGVIHTIRGSFGFLRPEEKTGDRDVFFYLKDCVTPVRVSNSVTYDTTRDERGMSAKDVRAVNIARVQVAPYAAYDFLDTMPCLPSNSAQMWCLERMKGAGNTATLVGSGRWGSSPANTPGSGFGGTGSGAGSGAGFGAGPQTGDSPSPQLGGSGEVNLPAVAVLPENGNGSSSSNGRRGGRATQKKKRGGNSNNSSGSSRRRPDMSPVEMNRQQFAQTSPSKRSKSKGSSLPQLRPHTGNDSQPRRVVRNSRKSPKLPAQA